MLQHESEGSCCKQTWRSEIYLLSILVHAETTASHLKKHIENKHDGVRYTCSQCDYVAT